MSISRQFKDAITSRWLAKPRRFNQAKLLTGSSALVLHIRLNDPYSYLISQELVALNKLLVDELKPLQVVIHHQPATHGHLNTQDNIHYAMADAKALADQFRFHFDHSIHPPSVKLQQQARFILEHAALSADKSLRLLQSVFHMLWHSQLQKLMTLSQQYSEKNSEKEKLRKPASSRLNQLFAKPALTTTYSASAAYHFAYSEKPLTSAYFEYMGQQYAAIDDLLRLTRRLKSNKKLNAEPVFLMDYVEWGEHLVSDPVVLNAIQATNPELVLYVALEDPLTWILLHYLDKHMAGYYNLNITIKPVRYVGRDVFNAELPYRLAKRTNTPFAPYCRPNAEGTIYLAVLLHQVPPQQQTAALLHALQLIWCEGFNINRLKGFKQLASIWLSKGWLTHAINTPLAAANVENATQWLHHNLEHSHTLHLPEWPKMELHRAGQSVHFCSLYRIWRIEAILAKGVELEG